MEPPYRELEFSALRATIRERGTTRLILVWATFVVWAGLVLVSVAWTQGPAVTLFTLLVLAAGFETSFLLHTGVERVGRYLQVQFERDGTAAEARPVGWESAAMRYGQRFPGRSDPLFAPLFLVAAVVNYFPVVAGGVAVERLGLGAFHALFVLRVVLAGRAASRQRAEDLERFRALLG
jgi:hypothetical protein